MIKWKISKEDTEVIAKIVKRAKEAGVQRDNLSLLMDISIAHQNCPLRLQELLEAKNFEFMHDVIGIVNHLNRDTGELEDFFLPRHAKPEVSNE